MNVTKIIHQLQLSKHPEGGWYRETYRSKEKIPAQALAAHFGDDRNYATAIYFLLESHEQSAFHRIKSDEMWHFYQGSPILIHVINPEGVLITHELGKDLNYQCVVPAHCWFAAEVVAEKSFALVGCTVSPGFDFADFEIANTGNLTTLFPQHRGLIERFQI